MLCPLFMVAHQRKWDGANGRPCSQNEHSAISDTNEHVLMPIIISVKSAVSLLRQVSDHTRLWFTPNQLQKPAGLYLNHWWCFVKSKLNHHWLRSDQRLLCPCGQWAEHNRLERPIKRGHCQTSSEQLNVIGSSHVHGLYVVRARFRSLFQTCLPVESAFCLLLQGLSIGLHSLVLLWWWIEKENWKWLKMQSEQAGLQTSC